MALGCDSQGSVFEEGVVAVVEDQSISEKSLTLVHAQLGAFGQARFRGPEGQSALLQSMVDLFLLDDQARSAGYEHDPRVDWAIVEELAARQERAVAERKVPRASVESKAQTLQRWVEEHPDEFWTPEKRIVRFTPHDTWKQAEEQLERALAGQISAEDIQAMRRSRPMERNDKDYPQLHRLLFDPKLKVGEWLPEAVDTPANTIVARLDEIQAAAPTSLDDPIVRAQVVDAVLETPQAHALEEYRAQLRRTWPTETQDG